MNPDTCVLCEGRGLILRPDISEPTVTIATPCPNGCFDRLPVSLVDWLRPEGGSEITQRDLDWNRAGHQIH